MLNELCQLADALEKASISPKGWHPQLKLLPQASAKKPCYRISIAENGSIVTIDTLPLDLAPKLRKWEPSNGSSFPGLNIQPLYRLAGEEQKKHLKAWREGKQTVDARLLESWCTEKTANWDKKHNKKLSKCIREIPKSLYELIGSEPNASMPIMKLINRTDKLYKRVFREEIENYLWSKIKQGEAVRDLLPVLIYEGSANKKPEKDRGAFSAFFDIPDWNEFPVAHFKSIEWINAVLINNSKQAERAPDIFDAYGISFSRGAEKLPSVKLPIIADVKLRAMNSESPCQFRYGSIDAESFPVGPDSRKRAKGALEWLGDESREGETWGRADIKELIFAYPVQIPNVSLKLAACFGAQKSEERTEARFANAAKSVIDGLKASAKDLNAIELRVFSLKKMDKARTKVVFHRNYTAQRLVDASRQWETGCTNIPDISIRVWSDKKGEWTIAGLRPPFPLQVAPCLNRIWKQEGTTECEAPLVAPSEGIDLLLDEQPERFVPHLLATLLQNGKNLLLSLGNMSHRGEIVSVKGYDENKLLLAPLLGLLLYKLNIRKENYMIKTPFLVGQMLKLADELHALYCKEVRDNNLPPQLIGNTLMTAALESPVQALAQLALRIKPYYGWARTFKGNEKGNLGGYFVGLYGEVAEQLAKQELPLRFNDAERAQLLLGYLAANPKKEAN